MFESFIGGLEFRVQNFKSQIEIRNSKIWVWILSSSI